MTLGLSELAEKVLNASHVELYFSLGLDSLPY